MTADQTTHQAAYEPSDAFKARAHVTPDTYARLYAQSLSDPTTFWDQQGQRIDWIKPTPESKIPISLLAKSQSNGMKMAH